VGVGVVPIVPAATIFDLGVGDPRARPTPEMAWRACEDATPLVTAQGSVGAGTGATVGKALGQAAAMKGGVGVAVAGEGGVRAAAVAVVNALGDVRDAAGRILAGARTADGAFADSERTAARAAADAPFGNTTICVVAVTVPLDRPALAQLARAATAALFRRITPCGTSYDGDVVFAACPARPPAGTTAGAIPALQLEALAVAALERAIEEAVVHAVGRDALPGLADG
jgi:L-aminopeptidase/D-esterase-like protein